MNKRQMVQTRSQRKHSAAVTVQKAVRDHLYMKLKIDPISLDKLEKPVFKYVNSETNFTQYFSTKWLHEYITKSGDVRYPTDRTEMNPIELTRLFNLAKAYGLVTKFETLEVLKTRRKTLQEQDSMIEYLNTKILELFNIGVDICNESSFSFYERLSMILHWQQELFHSMIVALDYIQQLNRNELPHVFQDLQSSCHTLINHARQENDCYCMDILKVICDRFLDSSGTLDDWKNRLQGLLSAVFLQV